MSKNSQINPASVRKQSSQPSECKKKNSQLIWQMSKNELVNLANTQKSSIDYANVQKKFFDPDKCQRKVYSTRQMTKNFFYRLKNNLLISLIGFIIEHLVQKLGKCPKSVKLTLQMSENSLLNTVNVKKTAN